MIQIDNFSIGDNQYRLGHLSPEKQVQNLHLIQKHDSSGAFAALCMFGVELKPGVELENPEETFASLAQTVMVQMQRSMPYEEWKRFIEDMLSKVFVDGAEDPQPASIKDFQGRMRDLMLLVAKSIRFQYSDFFVISGRKSK